MPRSQRYDIGDQPTSTAVFRALPPYGDDEGPLADPLTITVVVQDPLYVETLYDEGDCAHVSTGVWRFTLPTPLDREGIWTVKWFGTSGVVAAGEESFRVDCGRVQHGVAV